VFSPRELPVGLDGTAEEQLPGTGLQRAYVFGGAVNKKTSGSRLQRRSLVNVFTGHPQ